MAAPALLVAARAKYLASDDYNRVMFDIGSGPDPDIGDWVFVDVNPRTGLPDGLGLGFASVVFYQRPGQWHTNDTSARFPILAATVYAQGDPSTRDGEWQAREVADSVISCFNDFAGEQDPVWSDDVFVVRCRWSGELAVYEAEGLQGTYRADLSFEVETA